MEFPARITVQITRANAAEGHACHSRTCPLALALRDAGYPAVSVGSDDANVYENDDALRASFGSGLPIAPHRWARYVIDAAGQRFIDAFDLAGGTAESRAAFLSNGVFPCVVTLYRDFDTSPASLP